MTILRRSQKYDEISKLFCKLISNKIWRFRQIFVAFSEYMNPIVVPYLISARFKSHHMKMKTYLLQIDLKWNHNWLGNSFSNSLRVKILLIYDCLCHFSSLINAGVQANSYIMYLSNAYLCTLGILEGRSLSLFLRFLSQKISVIVQHNSILVFAGISWRIRFGSKILPNSSNSRRYFAWKSKRKDSLGSLHIKTENSILTWQRCCKRIDFHPVTLMMGSMSFCYQFWI